MSRTKPKPLPSNIKPKPLPANTGAIFEDVQKTFLSSLSPKERQEFKTFPDAKAMLASSQTITQRSPIYQSRLTACLKHVQDFASRLTPFFEIVDIFVSSNPEYAALAWGAIRLVFLVGVCSWFLPQII